MSRIGIVGGSLAASILAAALVTSLPSSAVLVERERPPHAPQPQKPLRLHSEITGTEKRKGKRALRRRG